MEAEHLSFGGTADLSLPASPFYHPAPVRFAGQDRRDPDLRRRPDAADGAARIRRCLLGSSCSRRRRCWRRSTPATRTLEVTCRLDSHLTNGSLHLVQYNADSPTGVAWADGLSELFYNAPPVKEFRKKYPLTRVGGKKHLLSALLATYKQFGGTREAKIAILEFRPLRDQPERVRAVPRFLPEGRVRGGDRFARSAGVPERRAAARESSRSTWSTGG